MKKNYWDEHRKHLRYIMGGVAPLLVILLGIHGYRMLSAHRSCGSVFCPKRTICPPEQIFRRGDVEAYRHDQFFFPVAIIGGGSAGLSAAIYTARALERTVVFGGYEEGGLLAQTGEVENWPGLPHQKGYDIMNTLLGQAKEFGATYVPDEVEAVDLSQWPFKIRTRSQQDYYALAVIIATGATPKKLEIEGEEEFWGRGVSSCAVCDAPLYKDKEVLVVGGGDSAAEFALHLARYARRVFVYVRGKEMRATAIMQQKLLKHDNVIIVYTTKLVAIRGDVDGVTHVELLNREEGVLSTVKIDGVFLAIGHEPNSCLFEGVDKTPTGYISLKKRTQATSIEGVFAAGEVADDRYKQAGVAAGQGIAAALD
ncbi:MAG: FAD-dependent oxidoreductase, partial [Candidatus Babeliales bacterium]